MIQDRIRTNAYRDAILNNKHLFKDKIVMDVGCGTGILSMFAAKAGAKKVYAIEYSDIACTAKKIISDNKFSDVITVIKTKMEDLKTLPGEYQKVDIIISEWMGYALLYESMLDSVIYARDTFLKKDGILYPDRAVILLNYIEDKQYYSKKTTYWDDVYGFDMSCLKDPLLQEPVIDKIPSKCILGSDCVIADFDLYKIKISDLDFVSK